MPLVKTKFGKKHRMSRKFVEIIDKFHRILVNHHKNIEIILAMHENNFILVRFAEIIMPGLESMPQHTVAVCAPKERSRRRHAAVNPVVCIFNGYGFPFMAKPPVLNASAKEILVFTSAESECCARLVKLHGFYAFHYNFSGRFVGNGNKPRRF